jgi:hypothetical protein
MTVHVTAKIIFMTLWLICLENANYLCDDSFAVYSGIMWAIKIHCRLQMKGMASSQPHFATGLLNLIQRWWKSHKLRPFLGYLLLIPAAYNRSCTGTAIQKTSKITLIGFAFTTII